LSSVPSCYLALVLYCCCSNNGDDDDDSQIST